MSEILENNPDTTLPEHVEKAIRKIGENEGLKDITLDVSLGSEKGDNYLGKILKIKMSGDTSAIIPLIVKISPFQDKALSVNNLYKKEISAYEQILPALYSCQVPYVAEEDRFNFAKYYYGSVEVGNEFVIMEDLCDDGYKIYGRKKTLDCDHLALVMKILAQFHATSFVLQHKDEEQFKKFLKLISYEVDYSDVTDQVLEKSNENLLAQIDDTICKEKTSHFLKDIKNRYGKYLDTEITAPYNVITHGDCWNGNFIFKYRDNMVTDLKPLDWQTIQYSSPVIDIAYMMFTCTDESTRNQHYLEMLELYYHTLDKNINKMGLDTSKCYPKSVFEDHVKMLMNYGLITAISILPMILSDDEPKDITEEDGYAVWFSVPYSNLFIERINGVIRDFVKYKYI